MARISKAKTGIAITAAKSPSKLKLLITNSSTSKGRYHQMLRIKPTLLARLEGLVHGPFYLVAEHALGKLCDELEAMPQGEIVILDAFKMDPTTEDADLLETYVARRVERGPRKNATIKNQKE